MSYGERCDKCRTVLDFWTDGMGRLLSRCSTCASHPLAGTVARAKHIELELRQLQRLLGEIRDDAADDATAILGTPPSPREVAQVTNTELLAYLRTHRWQTLAQIAGGLGITVNGARAALERAHRVVQIRYQPGNPERQYSAIGSATLTSKAL